MTTNDDRSGTKPAPILRRRWQPWILVPAILGAVIGAVVAARTTPLYKSETVILVVPQRVPESYARSPITTQINDRLQSLRLQILSRTRIGRLIQEFDLYKEERRKSGNLESVIEMMRNNVEVDVEMIERGAAFRLAFIGTDPRTVMKVTDRLAALFIKENLADRQVLAEAASQFLLAEAEGVRRRLGEQNTLLRAARETGQPETEPLAIEYEVLRTTFKDLLGKIEEARLATDVERRQIGEQLRILGPARVPERPIAPDWRRHVGFGAGAGAAIGLLVLLLGPPKRERRVERATGIEPV